MLFKEYDLEEAKEYWKKEAAEKAAKEADAKARKEATKEATSRTLDRDGKLFGLLLSQKRYDDARKAAADAEYRMKLFELYGI